MLRDRIKGLIYLVSDEIEPHPKNRRRHPEEQRGALRAVLERVGIASACLVYQTGGRYRLIDGELRRGEISEQRIPCLELDVNDDEAEALLAGMDSIAGLADVDDKALQKLIDELKIDGLEDLLKQIEPDAMLDELEAEGDEDELKPKYEIAPVFDEGYHSLTIFAKTELQWSQLQQMLDIQRRLEKPLDTKAVSPVGICRVMTFSEFEAKWKSR